MPLAAGVYTRVRNWLADANALIAIEPALHDTEDDSIAAALNLAWYRDGQAAATANIPMGGFKFTNVANGSSDTDFVALGQANGLYLLKAQLAAGVPVNASLTSSVSANALTIALKNAAGDDPSSASPVLLPFRSATAATGSLTTVAVTGATSLVISSGSTLGTLSSSVPFRIWVVAFNDGGTIRLAAINCLSSISIRSLQVFELASSTTEGGAGAADSAQVFYSGTGVSAKPYCVLGYLEWGTGIATAGTWNSDPTIRQAYGPDVKLPGMVVQTVISRDAAVATGTTQMPFDNTIPQNTEGDQYMSQAVTPLSAANILQIIHRGTYASSVAISQVNVALFQDSTANALNAQSFPREAAAGAAALGQIFHRMLAAVTSSTTFKIRAGGFSAGTTTFNGSAGAGLFNGTNYSTLEIQEIMA